MSLPTSSSAPSAPRRREACTRPCARLCTEAGFTEAYRTHRTRLLGGARAVLGDAGMAEDAVQEAFVRAWAACSTFDADHGPPMISWLLRITRNVVIDHARARAVRPRPARSDAEQAPERAEGRSTTDRNMDAVVLRTVLLDALAAVSDEHRHALVSTIVQDRSYADVAAELGVPVGTVKSRVHYALRGLRGVLGPGGLVMA